MQPILSTNNSYTGMAPNVIGLVIAGSSVGVLMQHSGGEVIQEFEFCKWTKIQ